MSKSEAFIYVLATLLLLAILSNTAFSSDFMNVVGAVSGALSFVGVLACAAALLWRRLKIRNNRKVFGDKAEALERSISETVVYIAKGIAGLWLLFVVIGFIERLRQHL